MNILTPWKFLSVRGEYKFDRVNEFVKHYENTGVFCKCLKGNYNAISYRNRLKKRLNSCDIRNFIGENLVFLYSQWLKDF